jgi:hypothetical protein
LKLAQQLAEYLASNKKLTLQGIGSFLLDNAYNPDPDNRSKSIIQGNISFESNTGAKTDEGLIEYISAQTGKMKPLATADVESQLELVHQFLNIGKPYLFDGIGTIAKTKDGSYSFVQGVTAAERIPDRGIKEHNEDMPDFKSVFLKEPKRINWRKPMIALFILLGLGLVILGGYYLYKKTSEKETVTGTEITEPEKQEETVLVTNDTATLKKDSTPITQATPPVQQTVSTDYKFVVDQFKAPRAFTRFNQLKDNGWDIKMETKDSVTYKLFITMPAASTDTTRALDSLTALNGRRVFIEHNN